MTTGVREFTGRLGTSSATSCAWSVVRCCWWDVMEDVSVRTVVLVGLARSVGCSPVRRRRGNVARQALEGRDRIGHEPVGHRYVYPRAGNSYRARTRDQSFVLRARQPTRACQELPWPARGQKLSGWRYAVQLVSAASGRLRDRFRVLPTELSVTESWGQRAQSVVGAFDSNPWTRAGTAYLAWDHDGGPGRLRSCTIDMTRSTAATPTSP